MFFKLEVPLSGPNLAEKHALLAQRGNNGDLRHEPITFVKILAPKPARRHSVVVQGGGDKMVELRLFLL